jgi:hypothetical protein
MGTTATRWNLVVSPETDSALRQFLANDGGGRKGDLSKFVEEAVRARVFELSARRAREENKGQTKKEIEAAVVEALEWARSPR